MRFRLIILLELLRDARLPYLIIIIRPGELRHILGSMHPHQTRIRLLLVFRSDRRIAHRVPIDFFLDKLEINISGPEQRRALLIARQESLDVEHCGEDYEPGVLVQDLRQAVGDVEESLAGEDVLLPHLVFVLMPLRQAEVA